MTTPLDPLRLSQTQNQWMAYPVRGEGREQRMTEVKRFLHHHYSKEHGDRLAEGVESGAYKCRLVYKQSIPKGVFIYNNETTEKIKPLSRCIEFKAFGTIGDDTAPSDLTELFAVAVSSAREVGARSIAFKIKQDQFSVNRALLTEGCTKISQGDGYATFGKSLLDAGKKRKGEEDSLPASRLPSYDRAAARDLQAAEAPGLLPLAHQQGLRVTLKNEYIRQIQSGKKTVEGRIHSGMFSNIRTGQNITFFAGANSVECRVKSTHIYPSFSEMLKVEGFKNCVNEASSFEHAVRIYESIPGYVPRAAQHGVVAIGIEKK